MATKVTISGSEDSLRALCIALNDAHEADVDASLNRGLRIRLEENDSPELDFAVEEIW